MLRLAGILIGAALAIGFLIVMLGKPQLSRSDAEPVAPGLEPVSELTGSESVSTPATDREPGEDAPVIAAQTADVDQAADAEPEGLQTDPELSASDAALVEQVFAPETERQDILPVLAEPVTEEHWYAFWSPFRSEIAAQGFVARLQETTGIDYRVVRVKTGVYEVAFAYTDDADIQAKLERIAGATGLDMSGG
jgi:hypothetical protein